MSHSKRALIVIDIQQDYFPDGNYPLWNTEQTLANILAAIERAKVQGVAVILVQHIAAAAAPFFRPGSHGAEIHPAILAAAPDATIVIKAHADSFVDTSLEATLQALNIDELLVCGMMTQNCVTHTAISRSAEKYQVAMLADCCTTVDPMLHAIALSGVATRMKLVQSGDVL
jgi:nicotinamidase-related amidase